MILSALALCLAQAVPQDDAYRSDFEARLDELRVRLKMPGLAVGVVRDGELWWSRGLGFADVENEIPVTAETPFHLASLTKTFASTVLMRLVQEGALDLDTPLCEFGVELESPGVITVRHVFSHTSEGTPGESYSYSGNRFGSLDRVLEEITTVPFEQVVDELVLTPLELNQTGPQTRALQPALAQGYQLDASGTIVRGTYPTFFGMSAGLVSSISDLARFYSAVADNELLDPATQELAFTPTRSTLGHELPYGLGWFTEEYLGTRVLWHYGWWNCISSLVVIVPERELTFLALANSDHLSRSFGPAGGHGSLLGSPFALAFFREFVHADPEAPWPDVDWSAAPDELRARFDSSASPTVRALLECELWARLSTCKTVGNSAEEERLLELYGAVTRLGALEELAGNAEIARIDRVGPNRDERFELTCRTDTSVRIVAVGELGADRWYDQGWIENAAGEVLWRMSTEASAHAGGASSNRVCTGRADLPAGTYRLRYETDGGHDHARWKRRPPDGLFWGIALFEE